MIRHKGSDRLGILRTVISSLIAAWGYPIVFLGTMLEGETILLAAGFAAHQGLLDWRLVTAIAMAGASLGDQLAFLLGRRRGAAMLRRFPVLARRAPRVNAWVARWHVGFILANRFIYGLRIAGPVVLGMSGLSPARFALLNVLGAAIWAITMTALGYTFGAALAGLLTDLKRVEESVLVGILGIGAGIWLVGRLRAGNR
jgi:membrane protein DedA with SNARE-associated domain